MYRLCSPKDLFLSSLSATSAVKFKNNLLKRTNHAHLVTSEFVFVPCFALFVTCFYWDFTVRKGLYCEHEEQSSFHEG